MRYEVSVGNSFRGEFKLFWTYKKAMEYAEKQRSPFVSIRDRFTGKHESINFVKDNTQHLNKKAINVKKMKLYYDGSNVTYFCHGSDEYEIIDNGHKFKCFAVNGFGENMYWYVEKTKDKKYEYPLGPVTLINKVCRRLGLEKEFDKLTMRRDISMKKIIIILVVLMLWFGSGASGFIYWWTTDFDYTIKQLPLTAFVSIAGPFTWGAGYFIHGDNKVLISKKL